MEPMNRFLAGHRQGLKNFLDAVCDIPGERNGGFALPASYSTPITILARLPPTSREGFPSLPYLIDHPRNFASLVKLWLDAVANYVAPHGLEGELLQFHELCLGLQQRTDDCLLKAEEADRSADQLSLQWEDIVETLQSSTIHDVTSPSLYPNPIPEPESGSHSPLWTEYSAIITGGQANQIPPGSAGSEAGSRERKDRQSFWESTFGKESKYQKPYDDADGSQASPPSRGQSRNGKSSKSFLGGLRRKGKGAEQNSSAVGSLESGTSPGSSWNTGGMI